MSEKQTEAITLRQALEGLRDRLPIVPQWSHQQNAWVFAGKLYSDAYQADHLYCVALANWADEVIAALTAHPATAGPSGTDLYASYANHCAIQKTIPDTWHNWKRNNAMVLAHPADLPTPATAGPSECDKGEISGAQCPHWPDCIPDTPRRGGEPSSLPPSGGLVDGDRTKEPR